MESVVSLDRPVAAVATDAVASEVNRAMRASERRFKGVQPFSIELVEFARLMTGISICQIRTEQEHE
jgi:hypothetical protein